CAQNDSAHRNRKDSHPAAHTVALLLAAESLPHAPSTPPPRLVFPTRRPFPPAPRAHHIPSPINQDKAAAALEPADTASHPCRDTAEASRPSVNCCPFPCHTCRSLQSTRSVEYCDSASATHPSACTHRRLFAAVPHLPSSAPVPTP